MKENELQKIHKVENTPFGIVETKENCKIIMGNQLMTNRTFESVDKAKKWIHTKPWELIIPAAAAVAQAVHDDIINLKK